MNLRPITNLHENWGWIRNGLLHCRSKTGDRHLPEDVYVALRAGTSHVFALDRNGDDIGFAVLQRQDDPDGACLFVWALWAEPHAARAVEGEIYAALEGKAREIGARRLRMQSARKAWQRERYWREVARVYEHEVTA